MEGNNDNQKNLGRLYIGGAENGIQVPDEENARKSQAHGDKDPVHDGNGGPRDQGHGDPDEVCVAVEGDAFEQVGALGAEPLQRTPQRDGDEEGVAVDQARGAGQQGEVVDEVFFALLGQVLRDCAGEEEDDDDGGRDPKGPVQVRVAVQDVEEVCVGPDGGAAAAQDFVGVDVEELGVEGDGPEVVLAVCLRGPAGGGQEGRVAGGKLAAGRVGGLKV